VPVSLGAENCVASHWGPYGQGEPCTPSEDSVLHIRTSGCVKREWQSLPSSSAACSCAHGTAFQSPTDREGGGVRCRLSRAPDAPGMEGKAGDWGCHQGFSCPLKMLLAWLHPIPEGTPAGWASEHCLPGVCCQRRSGPKGREAQERADDLKRWPDMGRRPGLARECLCKSSDVFHCVSCGQAIHGCCKTVFYVTILVFSYNPKRVQKQLIVRWLLKMLNIQPLWPTSPLPGMAQRN
jgi:hypothetical protein